VGDTGLEHIHRKILNFHRIKTPSAPRAFLLEQKQQKKSPFLPIGNHGLSGVKPVSYDQQMEHFNPGICYITNTLSKLISKKSKGECR
jgi:hypothetical protein